jgi:hypothetical protein
MTWWAWFHAWSNTNSGAVSILGVWITAAALLSGWIWTRSTTKLITAGEARTQALVREMHAGTQDTLKHMDASTQDTLRQIGVGITTMDTGLKTILDRMDERAEARYRDLRDRLDGEEEIPSA